MLCVKSLTDGSVINKQPKPVFEVVSLVAFNVSFNFFWSSQTVLRAEMNQHFLRSVYGDKSFQCLLRRRAGECVVLL